MFVLSLPLLLGLMLVPVDLAEQTLFLQMGSFFFVGDKELGEPNYCVIECNMHMTRRGLYL